METYILKNKTVLVTGGAGAIGSNLVSELVKWGNKVIVIDDLDSGYRHTVLNKENCVFIEGDILDEETLSKAFSHSPSMVFHLAAFFANQRSVDYPERDLEVNGKGTLKLLQFSQKNKVERFIYASSSCIYGNRAKEMIETDLDLDDFETPYAISKFFGEKYVKYFNRYYGLPTVILRYFNSYGPGDFPGKYKGVIPNFIKRALKGEPLIITGTGEETRTFTYVRDVVAGTIAAAVNEDAIGQIFNMGSDNEIKIINLAEKIKVFTNSSSEIQFGPRRDWDNIKNRKASIEKAKQILGYNPKCDFDEGLKMTIDWVKNNLEAGVDV